MSDNKVTLDQLDNSAVEAMSSSVGDVSMLNTENKTIVGAISEIVGKKEIANAIGEPLAETDKFTEMSSEINGLLSTFKTNMMNAGVVVESGDKFKALIDKIKGLTEGEGNKGIQFATMIGSATYSVPSTNVKRYVMDLDIDFIPSYIFVDCQFNYSVDASYTCKAMINNINLPSFQGTNASAKISISSTDLIGNTLTWDVWGYYNLTNIDKLTYYAIGVGEEDTALRDSLASILENKGVEVTEEDDMASLISKLENIKINYMVPGLNNTLCGPANLQNIRDDSGSGGTVYEKTFTIPEFPTNYKGMRLSYNYSTNWSANKTYPVIVTHERNGEVINTIESSDVKATSTVVYKNFDLGLDYIPGDIIRIKTQSLMINDLEYGCYHHIMNIMITYENLIC